MGNGLSTPYSKENFIMIDIMIYYLFYYLLFIMIDIFFSLSFPAVLHWSWKSNPMVDNITLTERQNYFERKKRNQ